MKTYFFDSNGLRFSVDYLRLMKKEIFSLSLYEQAEFVDGRTYELVKQNKNLVKPSLFVSPSFMVNVTVIGNLAFIALNHSNDEQRQIAKQFLQLIKSKFYEKVT